MSERRDDLFRPPPEVEPARASSYRADVDLARREGEPDAERDAFLASAASARILARLQAAQTAQARASRRRRTRRWFMGAGVSAAMAATLLWFVLRGVAPDAPPPSAREDIRIKGSGSTMTLLRVSAGAVVPVRDGTPLRAGEKVRFQYKTQRGFVMIVSIEAAGGFTVFHPHGGSASAAVARPEGVLDGAIELDASPSDERVIALFTDAPLSRDAARALVERAYPPMPTGRDVTRGNVIALDGDAASTWFRKAVPK